MVLKEIWQRCKRVLLPGDTEKQLLEHNLPANLSLSVVSPPAGVVHGDGELPQANCHRLRPHHGQLVLFQSVCSEQSGHQ